MSATPATTGASEAEVRRLRDLLTRREIDHAASDLLNDARALVADVKQKGELRLRRAQLSSLEEIALAKGSVADITTFIARQLAKEDSQQAWRAGNLGIDLMSRLHTTKGKGFLQQKRDDIVEAVRQRLLASGEAVADTATVERLTAQDGHWKDDVHLRLARRYLGYVIAEYHLNLVGAANHQ